MMSTYRRQKRILWILIIVCVFLLLALLAVAVPQFLRYQAEGIVDYVDHVIQPVDDVLCPGDDLVYAVTLERSARGPVEIVQSWNRIDSGIGPLSKSIVRDGNVARQYEPYTVDSTRRTIPLSPMFRAGEVWEYTHSVRQRGTPDFSMYTVRFTIGDDCE